MTKSCSFNYFFPNPGRTSRLYLRRFFFSSLFLDDWHGRKIKSITLAFSSPLFHRPAPHSLAYHYVSTCSVVQDPDLQLANRGRGAGFVLQLLVFLPFVIFFFFTQNNEGTRVPRAALYPSLWCIAMPILKS